MIEFDCVQCGQHFSVRESHAGRRCRCRICGAKVTVPEPQTNPPAPGAAVQPPHQGAAQEAGGPAPAEPIHESPAPEAPGDAPSARVRALELALAGHAETIGAQAAQIGSLKEERAALERALARLEAERDEQRAARERAESELAESRALLGVAQDRVETLERAWEETKAEADRAKAFIDDLRAAEQALDETRALVAGMKAQAATVTRALAAAKRPAPKSRAVPASKPPSRAQAKPGPSRTKNPVPEGARSDDTLRKPRTTQARDDEEVAIVPEVVQDAPGADHGNLVESLMRFIGPQ